METALSTLAQVFFGPLVGTISDHYVPTILEKIGIKWDVTEEMEKLSVILLTIQEVLEDAEDKQTTSKLIHDFLRELKDIDYDVEDLLDQFTTEALLDPESTGITDKSMADRITQVIDKFDKTAKQRSELFNLTSKKRVGDRPDSSRVDPERETSALPPTDIVIGRDDEIKNIVNLLVNNSNAGNLSIYAIVGIGGLGMTTLAQMVYNNDMVRSHFEIRRWVCVSENFDVKSLMGDIIQSGTNTSSQTLDQLQRRLQEELSAKRFLLVLDDVWNEDADEWDKLKSSLKWGAKGSSIIVTTRSDKVASLMATLPVCRPNFLSEEDRFSLFKHRAFAEGEEKKYPKLEPIGKEIVKKCGGVPLALGGLLRFQREEKEWTDVQGSKLWDLKASILPALLLSYKHLPQHLRQCFAYCSIFPKDYRMKKEILIQLWMANGFLQPKGNMELEDIGNEVFNDLLWRGFFQEVTINHDISCKMHDLVHDLACSITRDECFSFVTYDDKQRVVGRSNTIRHLAIDPHILFSPDFSFSMFQSFLRTLLQLDRYTYYPLPPLNFSNLIYLRVLDLSGLKYLETLPESIAKLKLLRYLDLSGTGIAVLSDEVFGNLINLQTLKLRDCYRLKMLPRNMRKLTNLRHLDISGSTDKLLGMPVGMGKLKSLHMLSHFIVSEESGCGVGELQELDHLEGTLAIKYLGKVKDPRHTENAKLGRKKNIRNLWLDWYNSAPVPELSQTNSMNDEKLIADALQPHPNLVSLEFYNYGGSDFPRWMNFTGLCSLVTLKLQTCSKCKYLPTLGLLTHLKELTLDWIGVECIGNEFYCDEEEEGNNMMMKTRGGGGGGMVLFPSLEHLVLKNMHCLEEWKGWSSSSSALPSSSSRMKEGETQVSVFPVLKTLIIYGCPNLRTLPSLKCSEKIFEGLFETLEIDNCPNLRTLPSLPLSIQRLVLRNCSEKIFEGLFENLPHLSHLSIREFRWWSPPDQGMVLLQNLPVLQRLEIHSCDMLSSLLVEMQNLTSLKFLTIEKCRDFRSLNNCFQLLTDLHSLRIIDCPGLELLPSDFQPLISLKVLLLEWFPKLEVVPVVGSSTLKTISFSKCTRMKNLPEWITNQTLLQSLELEDCENLESLQEGFQQLTALQRLKIKGCNPVLHARCKDTGEDWHKIAHIPECIIRSPSKVMS